MTRLVIEITAGVIPEIVEDEHSRRYFIDSDEWAAAAEKGTTLALLAEVNGLALGYAGMLMLRPHDFNWVRTEWLWL